MSKVEGTGEEDVGSQPDLLAWTDGKEGIFNAKHAKKQLIAYPDVAPQLAELDRRITDVCIKEKGKMFIPDNFGFYQDSSGPNIEKISSKIGIILLI